MWSEIKRKLFHLIALIYVAGLIYIPRQRYLALLVLLLVVEFMIEVLRLKKPVVNQWFERTFPGLFRDEEKTRFSGVFWMLAGVTATVGLVSDVTVAATALLYLILGDAMASLVGKRVGGPHWPSSKKRLSGSLACFFTCLFVGMVLLRPLHGWPVVIVGALIATLVEWGIIPVNDNFSIPVASALALLVCI